MLSPAAVPIPAMLEIDTFLWPSGRRAVTGLANACNSRAFTPALPDAKYRLSS